MTAVALVFIYAVYATYDGIARPRGAMDPAAHAEAERALAAAREQIAAVDQELRKLMTEAEWEAYQRKMQEALEVGRRENETRRQKTQTGLDRLRLMALFVACGIGGLAGFVGLVAPVSCLWSAIIIRPNAAGGLTVQHRGALLPTLRSWSKDQLNAMGVLATEMRAGYRGLRRRIGYEWRVTLSDEYGLPLVEFRPDQQKERPMDGFLSERTAAFSKALTQMTGISCGAPAALDVGGPGVVTNRRVFTTRGEPKLTRRTFNSLDDLPPELRARAEQMLEQSRAEGRPIEQSIETSRTFCSLDDVPEHLRPEVERLIGQAKEEARCGGIGIQRSESHTITYRDSEGNVHTFDSPDAMPPEIRALYERSRRKRG